MKSSLTVIFFILSNVYNAQYQPDYIVQLNNDTIRAAVNLKQFNTGSKVRIRINGKKQVFDAQNLKAVYSGGFHYEPVFFRGNWNFMLREFSGDVTVYRRTTVVRFEYYFRQRALPKGEIRDLTEKELKNVTTYACRSVMDSLLNKEHGFSIFLPDLVKQYNNKCPAME